MAIGGAYFAHFVGTFSPDDFYLPPTILTMAMLVVGGRGSLSGAVIGTLAVTVVSESLIQVENGVHVAFLYLKGPAGLEQTGLAAFLILALIFRKNGIMAGKELFARTVSRPITSISLTRNDQRAEGTHSRRGSTE
jgi:branched-chain amino acid transport system permease protein